MNPSTQKARDIRLQQLIRKNPDAKRLHDENVALRILVRKYEADPEEAKKVGEAKKKAAEKLENGLKRVDDLTKKLSQERVKIPEAEEAHTAAREELELVQAKLEESPDNKDLQKAADTAAEEFEKAEKALDAARAKADKAHAAAVKASRETKEARAELESLNSVD